MVQLKYCYEVSVQHHAETTETHEQQNEVDRNELTRLETKSETNFTLGLMEKIYTLFFS